ncbi:hypothetical protein [Listeria costaricensis]|uniref:hypothetical protein n=1 Tax=Listeria costaricensis TaxID=2026604 RepID=UPI000C086BA4|nr:hypothetical protein [Listeria costaricensis]
MNITFPLFCEDISQALHPTAENLLDTTSLLPYENAGISSYRDRQFLFTQNGETYQLFGHSFTGYFRVVLTSKTVVWLTTDSLNYCNAHFEAFALCQQKFFKKLHELSPSHGTIDFDSFMQEFLTLDPTITKYNYGGTCIYKLSDDFYPLTDAQLQFYTKLYGEN